jgi:hypothetical protein
MQAEARELGRLSLHDALRLVELSAAHEGDKFERAALRWYERFLAERQPTLLQAQVALAALGELRGGSRVASKVLVKLSARKQAA